MSELSAPQRKPTVRMDEEEIWKFVGSSHTGILTTLKADGSPVSLPIWFVLLDRKIYFSTRGKKLVRITNNPVSSFLVEEGERWAELRAVHLSGRCEMVGTDAELKGRFRAESERKYGAFRTATTKMPESSQKAYTGMGLLCFVPEGKILSWDNNKLEVA